MEEKKMGEGRTEEDLDAVLQSMGDAFISMDHEWRYTHVNDRALKLLGMKRDELIGRTIWEVFPDTVGTAIEDGFRKVMEEREPYAFETYYPPYDMWLDIRVYPYKHGISIFYTNSTDRRKTHEELRESEEKYRFVVENAREGILIVQDGLLKFANQATADILGYPMEILMSTHHLEFVHPDDRDMIAGYHSRRMRGEEVPKTYASRALRSDGTIRWVESKVVLISWQGRPATLNIVSDITERKRMEDALQESEAKYRMMVENSLVGVYIVQDGIARYVNKRWCDIFGYTYEEAVDRLNYIDTVHPDDREIVQENVRKRASGEVAGIEYEFKAIRKDGKTINVKALGTSATYCGRPAVTGTIIDVTWEKALEVRLLQAQKMESIGTLAGGVAHDFNNILMGILGYASLMLLDLDPTHPHYDRAKSIESLVQSGSDLTRQLLGFARGGRFEVKPTDLNKILERTSELFGRTKKEIAIHRKLEQGLWAVEVDGGQMEQVLLNLYVNAWQAMPAGGEIFLETQNVSLEENYTRIFQTLPGKYVRISVTDTGVGMDESTKARIFEPFFTTKEMGRGTGLGLAMVYGIIQGHKGIINVYSEKGQGTTFNIYLPVSEKSVREKEDSLPEAVRGMETILVVDDEAVILKVTKELLEKMGYRVITAGGGREAIEIYGLRKDEIDLVLLDMMMPGVSGHATFEQLKAINPDINVILSSGYSMNGHATDIMNKGCRAFIQKPFGKGELSRKIREALGG